MFIIGFLSIKSNKCDEILHRASGSYVMNIVIVTLFFFSASFRHGKTVSDFTQNIYPKGNHLDVSYMQECVCSGAARDVLLS